MALAAMVAVGCSETRRTLVATFSGSYNPEEGAPLPPPVYDGKDSVRTRIPIQLTAVASGLARPTDIQFDPSRPELMIVLEQTGTIRWFDLNDGSSGIVHSYTVLTVSEQGLLGMAFHPAFPDTPLVYLNMSVHPQEADVSRILEVRFEPPADLRESRIMAERVLLEVEQPYQNHNAGQLAFGPDGYLYIGWGDGGWAGDPHNNSQNPATMLGSMLRIDVRSSDDHPYLIPPDNPFVADNSVLPEIWAIGLRNPWRYSFDPAGRLIVADVGQDKWEEIDIVEPGGNYGWHVREGSHCYNPPEDCEGGDMIDPILEYGHDEGQSITGGYVYLAGDFPALKGLYIYGDFIAGRLWAITLPPPGTREAGEPRTLGRRDILISTFGRDPEGKVYFADFTHGVIYRIDPLS